MKKAMIPGTYDPITTGHISLIKKSAEMFDKVYVVISENATKKTMFSAEQRAEFAKEATKDIDNVEIVICSGLIIDLAEDLGVEYLCRGVRNTGDFEYEYNLAGIYKLTGNLKTVFIPAFDDDAIISSSMVRELIKYGKDASKFLPFELK